MPKMLLSCTINGEPSELLVQPYHTLLEASAHGSLLLRCVLYAVPIYPYHELGNV